MRTPTENKRLHWFFGLLVATLPLRGYADDAVQTVCHQQTNAVQQCRWITGTITASNGTPPIRIRPQGERRNLGVWQPEEEWMPDEIKGKFNFDNQIHAKMRICPISKKGDAGMALVCIDEVKDIRVSKR